MKFKIEVGDAVRIISKWDRLADIGAPTQAQGLLGKVMFVSDLDHLKYQVKLHNGEWWYFDEQDIQLVKAEDKNKLKTSHDKLVEVLKEILECPRCIDEATVPKGGIDKAPEQVVFNMSIGYLKIKKAEQALKEAQVCECLDNREYPCPKCNTGELYDANKGGMFCSIIECNNPDCDYVDNDDVLGCVTG